MAWARACCPAMMAGKGGGGGGKARALTDDWQLQLQADSLQQLEAIHVCGQSQQRGCRHGGAAPGPPRRARSLWPSIQGLCQTRLPGPWGRALSSCRLSASAQPHAGPSGAPRALVPVHAWLRRRAAAPEPSNTAPPGMYTSDTTRSKSVVLALNRARAAVAVLQVVTAWVCGVAMVLISAHAQAQAGQGARRIVQAAGSMPPWPRHGPAQARPPHPCSCTAEASQQQR